MDLNRMNDYIEGLYACVEGPSWEPGEVKNGLEASPAGNDLARMLRLLVYVTGAGRILDIGTGLGVSATVMAQALKDRGGRVVTIELDEDSAERAEDNFRRAGVAGMIELFIGDALAVAPELPGEFDLIFLNVDKRLYAHLLPDLVRLLRRGGVLAARDTLYPALADEPFRPEAADAVEEFNCWVRDYRDLESIILLVEGGLTLAVKK